MSDFIHADNLSLHIIQAQQSKRPPTQMELDYLLREFAQLLHLATQAVVQANEGDDNGIWKLEEHLR